MSIVAMRLRVVPTLYYKRSEQESVARVQRMRRCLGSVAGALRVAGKTGCMSTNERECARGRRRSVNAVAVTERERSSGDGARARMMKRAVPLHYPPSRLRVSLTRKLERDA